MSPDSITAYFVQLATAIATAGLNLAMLEVEHKPDGEIRIHFQVYGDPETVNRVNEIQAQVARRTGIQQ